MRAARTRAAFTSVRDEEREVLSRQPHVAVSAVLTGCCLQTCNRRELIVMASEMDRLIERVLPLFAGEQSAAVFFLTLYGIRDNQLVASPLTLWDRQADCFRYTAEAADGELAATAADTALRLYQVRVALGRSGKHFYVRARAASARPGAVTAGKPSDPSGRRTQPFGVWTPSIFAVCGRADRRCSCSGVS
jgi:hypothetical protein